MTQRLLSLLALIRIQTAGFQTFAFCSGPALAGWKVEAAGFLTLFVVSVLIVGYIFSLNDLVDLPHDRLDPKRARSPVVAGKVSERLALVLSVAFPLLGVQVIVIAGWDRAPLLWFLGMLVLAAFVNVYQKATSRPLVMDLLFSVTMAAPLPITCAAMVGVVPGIVWIETALLFWISLALNSIAGNLKDIESDLSTGFRTVALVLGARPSGMHRVHMGRKYRAYTYSLYSVISVTSLCAVWQTAAAGSALAGIGVMCFTIVLLMVGWNSLRKIASGKKSPSKTGRELYCYCPGLVFLGVVVYVADGSTAATLVIFLVLWEVGFALTRRYRGGSHRGRRIEGVSDVGDIVTG